MSRKRLVTMALGALSAMAFIVPSAQAQGVVGAAACVFEGVSGQAAPGVENIVSDLGPAPDILDTDSGTFGFTGSATCAGADANDVPPTVVGPATFDLSAGGTYNNVICGTGTANGTANLTDGGSTNIDYTFGIMFANGVGLKSLVVDGGTFAWKTVDGGAGQGVVHIVPNVFGGGGNCIDESVTSFVVNGSYGIFVSG